MISKHLANPTMVKLFSLLLAIVLWFFVGAQNPDGEMIFRGVAIRVEYQNETAGGVTVREMLQETADITLKGSKNVLSRLTPTDITAKIEVDTGLAPGYHTLPLTVLNPLENVTVSDKNPVSVRVFLDRTATSTVPVRAIVDDSALDPALYSVEEPRLNLESVELVGPETDLASIREAVVQLELLESNMMAEGIPLLLSLVNHDGEIEEFSRVVLSMRTAQLTPQVRKRVDLPITVEFLNRPEGWLATDFSYRLSAETAHLLVPVRDLTTMTAYEAGVIDLSLYEQDAEVELPLQSPYLDATQQETVTVSLRFGEMQTFRWALQNIVFDNIPEGLSAEVLSALPIDIGMRGTQMAVAAYSGSGLSGIVDLAGLSAGQTATLPIRIVTGDPEIGPLGTTSVALRMSGGEQVGEP